MLTNVLAGRLGYLNPLNRSSTAFPRTTRSWRTAALAEVGLAEQTASAQTSFPAASSSGWALRARSCRILRMILADEPVASLDPVLAHSILGYLEKLNQEAGITIICSLHYLDLVQRYASA